MGLIEFVVDAQNGRTECEKLGDGEHYIGRDVMIRANDERGKSQGYGSEETADGQGFFYVPTVSHYAIMQLCNDVRTGQNHGYFIANGNTSRAAIDQVEVILLLPYV